MWRLKTVYSCFSRPHLFMTGRFRVLQKENSDLETEQEKNQTVQFGGLRSGVNECQKQYVWKETTTAVSSVGVDN